MNLICAVALVLLVDVSGSVNDLRYQQQTQGLVEALNSPSVRSAILSQPGGVAISMLHWGTTTQVAVGWHHVRTNAELDRFTRAVSAEPRRSPGASTAVAQALQAAVDSFESAPCEPERQIIDISGDGSNNWGYEPNPVRDRAQMDGITINALAIITPAEPELVEYFRDNVITVDGFVVPAEGHDEVGRAMRRKLVLEIAGALEP
jgi:hypothetical protein